MVRARTLVVVNYHSADMACRAIETARAASSVPLQAVIVDNSGDPAERDRVAAAGADVVIDAPDNPGYGEGANRGRAAANGEILIVANPDVVFAPGSIDRLAAALEADRVVMSGPRFLWDAAGSWLLPPPELPTRRRELDRLLAGRSAAWRRSWWRRRREARVRFWRSRETAEVEALSGAVVCVRMDAFDRCGGFDPAFRLYFEEIDLMARLRAAGGRLVHVPEARCRHLYNQSAGRTSTAAARYVESELRFLSKWYGERFARWTLERRAPMPPPARFEDLSAGSPLPLPRGSWLIEASPSASFGTAAGTFSNGGEVHLPPEVLETLRGEELFVMATDLDRGRPGPAVRVAKTE
ncbi:MAG TPA: glycosyltransferase [Thermoanaerobaculia bacterium]